MKNEDRNQQGFTLIELVMIIVILGILGAVVIPKFVNLSSRAEESSEDGIIGGIRSGLYIWSVQSFATTGERTYPDSPFWALDVVPNTYDSTTTVAADVLPGEWGADTAGAERQIWHRRKNSDLFMWIYEDSIGTILAQGLQL